MEHKIKRYLQWGLKCPIYDMLTTNALRELKGCEYCSYHAGVETDEDGDSYVVCKYHKNQEVDIVEIKTDSETYYIDDAKIDMDGDFACDGCCFSHKCPDKDKNGEDVYICNLPNNMKCDESKIWKIK